MLLLVEDDAMLGPVTQKLLCRAGHKVELADSAADGIVRVRTGQFDLVLCDMNLGDGSALDVLAAMEEQDDAPPMILMTGMVSAKTAPIVATRTRIVATVEKPADPRSLRELVAAVLGAAR